MSKDGGFNSVNLNRRKAIHERCLNCVGWYSHEVKTCDFDDCSLHRFRRGVGKQDAKDRSRAIKDYCKWCTDGKMSACSSPLCPLYPFRKSGAEHLEETLFFPEKHHIGRDFNPSKGKAVLTPFPHEREEKESAYVTKKR